MTNLIYLKLGGSLITDKSTPSTARLDVIQRLAAEIAAALKQNPEMQLILGHGSGSFGHIPAKKYGTRQGVRSLEDWRGFAEVWFQASTLNRLVIAALHLAGVPAITCAPSAGLLSTAGQVTNWNTTPIARSLAGGLVPVVHGDPVFDTELGGTIFSTEDVFAHLVSEFPPARILVAGIEPGVWADYPACTTILPKITPDSLAQAAQGLSGSAATDVTGGMESKVRGMIDLIRNQPAAQVNIFSGEPEGQVQAALLGKSLGTVIAIE